MTMRSCFSSRIVPVTDALPLSSTVAAGAAAQHRSKSKLTHFFSMAGKLKAIGPNDKGGMRIFVSWLERHRNASLRLICTPIIKPFEAIAHLFRAQDAA